MSTFEKLIGDNKIFYYFNLIDFNLNGETKSYISLTYDNDFFNKNDLILVNRSDFNEFYYSHKLIEENCGLLEIPGYSVNIFKIIRK